MIFISWHPGARALFSQKITFHKFQMATEQNHVPVPFKPTCILSCQLSRKKNLSKSHRFPYLASDHGDVDGGDDDDDGVYAVRLSRTPYSRSLGRSRASLVRQLLHQRSLVASYYPDTSDTHHGSSWNE